MSSKVRVRFPNESYPLEVEDFKIEDFKISKKFDDEIFGYWIDSYVAVNRKDYISLLLDNMEIEI